ncbi:acyltransferase family protein [Enterovibrio norvegicus]|uniref:acyltransferase family protein n=1 Tax=Enterovibrio norvegicus TaxID=188144 RepID=UPI000C826E04|nr:acyltransferase family protein [Enterovibrio norvegicus]PML82015.1 acyltransferase [Enterovibrio norvegicus]
MLSYRKELDGLRALAVIAVIVYHANLQFFGVQIFKGGFFGVDVFFVLSGYLITGIIRSQMENGLFSFKDFYWRRAKRIIPILITVLFVTSSLAYLILLPDDLIVYAKSLQSALLFGSNHFFYGEDSYTASASIYRPLLHTWSLSVEWQFYIIFPFLIWIINKQAPRHLFPILLGLALLSLLATNAIVKVDPDMAFYLLPTRAWELIIGGLVTFYDRSGLQKYRQSNLESFAYKLIPIIGVFLVLYSMVSFDHSVSHPSFLTLLPVIGTCLFIMFSHEHEFTNKILTLKPIVWLGAISYSLYLWHNPIFVFFRFIKSDEFTLGQFLFLVAISMALSVLSYYFIENIYRRKKISPGLKFAFLFPLISCVIFSVSTPLRDGYPERLGVVAKAFDQLKRNRYYREDGVKMCANQDFENTCKLMGEGDRNLLLLGDSHAIILSEHLYLLTKKKGWTYTNFSLASCSGIDGYYMTEISKTAEHCNRNIPKIAEYIENSGNTKFDIIYSIRVDFRFKGNDHPDAQESVINKLNYWASKGHNIILVYSIPKHRPKVPNYIKQKLGATVFQMNSDFKELKVRTPYKRYLDTTKEGFSVFDSIHGDNVYRVYPSKVFCDEKWCYGKSSSEIYYYDDDHLSIHGARLLVDEIAKNLQ